MNIDNHTGSSWYFAFVNVRNPQYRSSFFIFLFISSSSRLCGFVESWLAGFGAHRSLWFRADLPLLLYPRALLVLWIRSGIFPNKTPLSLLLQPRSQQSGLLSTSGESFPQPFPSYPQVGWGNPHPVMDVLSALCQKDQLYAPKLCAGMVPGHGIAL